MKIMGIDIGTTTVSIVLTRYRNGEAACKRDGGT